jgi:membrane-associated phospholipid phosphatase
MEYMKRSRLPRLKSWYISLAALSVFVLLAVLVKPPMDGGEPALQHNFVTQFDQEINETAHRLNQESPLGVSVFNDITEFGSYYWIKRLALVVTLALVFVSELLVIVRGKSIRLPVLCTVLVLTWILVMALGEILNLELKDYVRRARPPYHEAAHASGYSFPSGHSMAAIIAYGMLAYVLAVVIPHRRIRRGLIVGFGVLVFLIGFSRVFLGAHWASDVVGGFAAGGCWLGLCIAVIETIRGMQASARRAVLKAETTVTLQPEPPMLAPEPVFPDKTL